MRICFALTSFASLVAACTDSPPPKAVFTGRTQQQLNRTMEAAMAVDALLAELTAVGYATGPRDVASCPQVITEGSRLHVKGGCTTSDGTTISGAAYLTNVPNLFGLGNDASQPARVEFDQLSLVDPVHGTTTFDGTLSWTAAATQVALDTELAGIGAREDASFTCASGTCTYGNATIVVDGVGEAAVTGTWAADYSTVALDVRGQDDLTISGSGQCLTYSIDGASSGQVCH